jgi:hypothetical protein
MKGLLVGVLAAACALPATAQPRFGPVQEPARQPPSSAPSARPFAATPYRSAEDERCANFRRELHAAYEAERQAGTTTARDQAATHRQQIFESMQKAGC